MTSEQLELLKYPIGKMYFPECRPENYIQDWIGDIADFPLRLQDLVKKLNEQQLDAAYRPEGWTVRQLIHHMADSHSHAYIRFKWALTEDNPLIKAYDEKAYAKLFDSKTAPIGLSLDNIKALHAKWVFLLEGMEPGDYRRTFRHPENGRECSLLECLAMYAWHGRHHYAHIEHLKKRRDWI
jgi:hypothetical protein